MVEISDISFTDEYTGGGATPTKFLMGNVGDKITSKITFNVHWEVLGATVKYDSATKTITLRTMANALGSSLPKTWTSAGFKKGDTFTIVGGTNAGNFTIASLNDYVLTTIEVLTSAVNTGIDFHGTTPINALDFYFNLIENSDANNFVSLTDSQTQQKKKLGTQGVTWTVATTVNLVTGTNSQGWDTSPTLGVDTATYVSVANYIQNFTLTHTFEITPYFLENQASNFKNGNTPPDYFADGKCLKYICQIDAKFNANDPAITHTTAGHTQFNIGNTGWFNEYMNVSAKAPDYTLTSIAYTKNSDSSALTSLDAGFDVDVVMVIHSAAGAFTNVSGGGAIPGSRIILHFAYCPLSQDNYVNTTQTLDQNFLHDRKSFTIGAASGNGDLYGTNYQVLKNIVSTFISANSVSIAFTVSFSTFIKTFLQGQSDSNRNYMFWVAPQNKNVTNLVTTDRNNVLCDFRNMAWNRDDSSYLTWVGDVAFYQYPDTTTNAFTDIKGFGNDGALAKAQFKIKRGIVPKEVKVTIQAYNTITNATFDLETYSFDILGLIGTNGEIPDAIDIIRDYKLLPTDPRNQITLRRNVALDTVTQFGYEIDYGFKLRYESWRFLTDFDIEYVQNPSEEWWNYSTLPNNFKVQMLFSWSGYDPLTAIKDPGTTFIRKCPITIEPPTFSNDGFGGTITCVISTSTLNGDAHGFIAKDQNTNVLATFTGAFTNFPAGVTSYGGILSLDIDGKGGVTFVDQATTEESLLSGSLWYTACTLTKVNNTTITLSADIDYTMLDDQVLNYLIYARLIFKP